MNSPRIVTIVGLCLGLAAFGCRTISPVGVAEQAPIQTQPIQLQADEWRVTDDVMVITDASGTMYVNETFPAAKALTQSFVAAMPEASAPAEKPGGYSAGAIGFGGDERNAAPLAAFNRSVLSSQAAGLDVMGSVDGMGGPTPLHAVIGEAAASLEGKRGRAALVIFSDGLPDDASAALGAAEGLIASHPGEVCIHTVQTGTSQEGYAFLKRLSALTQCGSLRNEDDVTTNFEVQQFARAVFVGPGVAPVAAAGPCEGVVRLRGIEFGFDKDQIEDSSKPMLDVAVERLNECPEVRITISGHTDSIGSEQYNNGLSYRRAEASKRYFVEQGIDASRLETEGQGEGQPIAPNDSDDGRAQNRRVELAPAR
jgi:OOP family OmpA-OmpF porin